LFDPKNARRIFYVHINRLLVHIGAFDPVHIGLLLCAKLTTAWTRSINAAAMVVTVPPRKEGPLASRKGRIDGER
jgi:nicotinic acid mononucleotide adenylyltransferase